ncbi:hypothetical protein BCR33DRAFT_713247 [Rhizoclosmatium globosum]|uniref:C3H1-type domain-containing protein n=1 Tax=Rhizoclosmatium globosum TaxID=329046 RepID=A0A1Y2CTR3_9FUNG|nr:hypothetical protein BCR33DRAFT_713247 [Rhizoclosmatium globosum]|eukprot:ORY50450.1 hypothetical protein BCR33DRAFT_713247 [Rhizoclosmatium globosum]
MDTPSTRSTTPVVPPTGQDMLTMIYKRMIYLETKVVEQELDILQLKAEMGHMKELFRSQSTEVPSEAIATSSNLFFEGSHVVDDETESAWSEAGLDTEETDAVGNTTETVEDDDESNLQIQAHEVDQPEHNGELSHDTMPATAEPLPNLSHNNPVQYVPTRVSKASDILSRSGLSPSRKRVLSPDSTPSGTPKRITLVSKSICTNFAVKGSCSNGVRCKDRHECPICEGNHGVDSCQLAQFHRGNRCVYWNCGSGCMTGCKFDHKCLKCRDGAHPAYKCAGSKETKSMEPLKLSTAPLATTLKPPKLILRSITDATSVICKTFNYEGICSTDGCRWKHVCLSCNQPHSTRQCTKKPFFMEEYCSFLNCFGDCKRIDCQFKHTCLMCLMEFHGSVDCPKREQIPSQASSQTAPRRFVEPSRFMSDPTPVIERKRTELPQICKDYNYQVCQKTAGMCKFRHTCVICNEDHNIKICKYGCFQWRDYCSFW